MVTSGPWPLVVLCPPPFLFFPCVFAPSFTGLQKSNYFCFGLPTRTTDHTALIDKRLYQLTTKAHRCGVFVCVFGRFLCSSWSVICLGWLIWVMALQIRVAQPRGSELLASANTLPLDNICPSLGVHTQSAPNRLNVEADKTSWLLQTSGWTSRGCLPREQRYRVNYEGQTEHEEPSHGCPWLISDHRPYKSLFT